MPQFDFSTYTSQIFWFLLCFSFLYYFLARKILPRIRQIIESRNEIINNNVISAKKLENDIFALQEKSEAMKKDAEVSYKKAIADAVKQASKLKEEGLQKFKIDAEKALEKSQEQISEIVKNSKEGSEKLAKDLQILIENKILN